MLTPAGRLVTFPGRPVDLALLPDGKTVVVKNLRDLIWLDAETGTILQTLRLPAGGNAATGLAVTADGNTVYTSTVGGRIQVAARKTSMSHSSGRTRGSCGLRPSVAIPRRPVWPSPPMGPKCLVLFGRGNSLWRFIQRTGRQLAAPIQVGIAPFGIVVKDTKAYVSNWGGDPPRPEERRL